MAKGNNAYKYLKILKFMEEKDNELIQAGYQILLEGKLKFGNSYLERIEESIAEEIAGQGIGKVEKAQKDFLDFTNRVSKSLPSKQYGIYVKEMLKRINNMEPSKIENLVSKLN